MKIKKLLVLEAVLSFLMKKRMYSYTEGLFLRMIWALHKVLRLRSSGSGSYIVRFQMHSVNYALLQDYHKQDCTWTHKDDHHNGKLNPQGLLILEFLL